MHPGRAGQHLDRPGALQDGRREGTLPVPAAPVTTAVTGLRSSRTASRARRNSATAGARPTIGTAITTQHYVGGTRDFCEGVWQS